MIRKACHPFIHILSVLFLIIFLSAIIVSPVLSTESNGTEKIFFSEAVPDSHRLKLNEPENYKFNEIAVVVKDIKESVAYYTDAFGLHFEPVKEYKIAAMEKGKLNNYTQATAFGRLGPIKIELIQIVDGESIHTEFLSVHGEGIHHLGFKVKDLEKEMANAGALGLKLISSFKVAGVMIFAYYEKANGIMIELVQENVREKIAAATSSEK